jgi:hypothetical protein
MASPVRPKGAYPQIRTHGPLKTFGSAGRREVAVMWTCTQCGDENLEEESVCDVCAERRRTADHLETPVELGTNRRIVPAAAPDPDATDPIPTTPADAVAGVPTASIRTATAESPVHAAPRRNLGPLLLVTLLIAGLAIASALTVPRLFGTDDAGDVATSPGVPTTDLTYEPDPQPEPTYEPAPEPQPTAAGIVGIGPAVADDRAGEVAAMFDTYFSGINDKDYDRVATVLDPAGSIDPADADEMAALERGTRTTVESDIRLLSLSDLDEGRLLADVAFRSTQDPGSGPKGRTSETCTRWQIAYEVSTSSGAYRLVKGKASSAPC